MITRNGPRSRNCVDEILKYMQYMQCSNSDNGNENVTENVTDFQVVALINCFLENMNLPVELQSLVLELQALFKCLTIGK